MLFAGVSGGNNVVQINEEFAATTRFGGHIAHGFLTTSVISAVANRLPGPGFLFQRRAPLTDAGDTGLELPMCIASWPPQPWSMTRR